MIPWELIAGLLLGCCLSQKFYLCSLVYLVRRNVSQHPLHRIKA